MILLDTSGMLAALFADQYEHAACARVLREARGPLLLSPFILAELDYLITKFADVSVELRFLTEVERGAYQLAAFDLRDMVVAREVIEKFRDQGIGLADASIVALAQRHRQYRVLTLDRRHFRVLTTPLGRSMELLPSA